MLDLEFFFDFYEDLSAKKDDGWKVLGFIAHEFIPEELLLAAKIIPLPLIYAGSEQLTHDGTVYLSPTTCIYARSIVGAFDSNNRQGKFKILDLVDGLICTNYCNAENIAIQSICKVHGLPRLDLFLPTSKLGQPLRLMHARLEKFKEELERFTGNKIPNEAIWDAIEKYNKARETLMRIFRSPLSDAEIQDYFKMAILRGPDWLEKNIDMEKIEARPPPKVDGKPVVALSGCPAFIGDGLCESLTDAGIRVGVDDTWLGIEYCGRALKPVDRGQDPLLKLLEIYSRDDSVRQVPESTITETRRVLNLVNQYRLSGVLHHQIKFCDMVPFLQEQFRTELQQRGIKYLWLERDYTSQDSGQILTRVEAFKETMKQ